MEQRKLIRLGNSSFAISLPKPWVENSGLKKGDFIFIERNSNGELIVMPNAKSTEEKIIEINIDRDEEDLRREISAAYVKGYNIFQFKGNKNKEKINIIKEVLNGLLSLEIVENSQQNLVAKDFFNIDEVNQENFIRRMDNNIREMFDLISQSLSKGEIKNIDKEIRNIDDDINKFYLLSSRIMFKGAENPSLLSRLKTTPVTLFNNWWLSFNLEHIGDEIKSISNIIKEGKIQGKRKEHIIRIVGDIKNIYINSLEAFYKKDQKLALKIITDGKKIWDECDELFKETDPTIIKLSAKFKNIETASYQNAKMVSYLRS